MQCHLTARYIPGQYNGIADGLSRAKALPEWHLSKTVLEMIFQKLGQPDIDLFASRTSAVVPAYVGLDLPSSSINPSSTPSSAIIRRPVPAGDPILATSVLGTRSSEACPTTSTEDSEPSVEFNRPANQPSSTRGGQVKFGGMDGTGWLNQIEDWSESEVLLLENSWRTSTLKTYKPVWSRWRQWAISHNIPVDSPKPQSLAKYLCHLFNEIKLAPRTVALHKSVVATFANPNQSLALSSHPLVKQVIKGIFARQPPQKKPLSWKIEDLLNFLKNYTFQEDSIFGVSRHTSLLLLLASGRRVHDLTLLNIEEDSFEDNGDEIIFWPKFGSKTDTASYRQSGWSLKRIDICHNRLDLVFWIRKLINISSSRRHSRNIHNLFITTRGVVKGASRSIIAGWVRSIFKEAKINASAGSFRAAVASDIWSSNRYDIDEVLLRGNWRSRNTFLNHYFKEIPKQSRAISNILIESFNPV
ncbi:hypothetical protein ACJJTC_018316 [Scirpophaga incertulas]